MGGSFRDGYAFGAVPESPPGSRVGNDQAAQVAYSAGVLPCVFGDLNGKAVFERVLQLHHAQTIQADIFAEAARIGDLVQARAGHRTERLNQRIVARGEFARRAESQCRARCYLPALDLACCCAREVRIRPEKPPSNLLVVSQGRVRLSDGSI